MNKILVAINVKSKCINYVSPNEESELEQREAGAFLKRHARISR